VNCAWCGKIVPVAQKGPIPIYCGRSHAQRAYAKRRSERLGAEIARREAMIQSDVEAGRAEAQTLMEVLRFYADPSNYVELARRGLSRREPSRSAVHLDGGRRAAEALRHLQESR
jgi:hypothetical protein